MVRSIQQLNALIDVHELAQGADRLRTDQDQVDRDAANRIEQRSLAFREVEAIDRRTSERMVSIDIGDLKLIRSEELRELALLDMVNNCEAVDYSSAASWEVRTALQVAQAAGRQWRAVADKDDRKRMEWKRRVAGSASVAAAAAAESVREEDRARLEAFASMRRPAALQRYPELQRAYELQDASDAFQHPLLTDRSTREAFRKLTDDWIHSRLSKNKPIPELRRRGRSVETPARRRDVEWVRPNDAELDP